MSWETQPLPCDVARCGLTNPQHRGIIPCFLKQVLRPDIIVHVRGSNKNNLIMIEAKKDTCRPEEKAAEKKRLRRNANKYQYTHAFLVVFPKDDVTSDSVIEVQ